jgi:hypothetical protein
VTVRFTLLAGEAIAASAALAAAGMAAATTPAPLWAGVERIAVRCSITDTAISAAQRTQLCSAVEAELRKRSAYQVVATGDGYQPDILGDLVVIVAARRAGAGAIALSLQPTRMGNFGATRNQPVSSVTIASGIRGAKLATAVAGAVNRILPTPTERRGRVPTPKRAS